MTDPMFQQLVQVALGSRAALDAAPTEAQWDALLQTARNQCVGGVLCRALEVLPPDQLPGRDQLREWMVERTRVVRRNALVDQRAREVTDWFAQAGMRSAVLKGQGVSRFYPDPTLRVSGDIDIWVPGGREAVLSALKDRIPLRSPVYHHVAARFFEDIEVEVHFLPAFLYNPRHNRRLQAWFESEALRWEMVAQEGFFRPKAVFDAVFSLVHISKHIINEGVGLRQVMDHHFILRALSGEEQERVRQLAASLGLTRLGGALSYVERELLGEAGCPGLFPEDVRRGERLLDDVLQSGNFGHADQRGGGRRSRFLRFVGDYPSEVLWSPLWKVWHRLWRKRKGYL